MKQLCYLSSQVTKNNDFLSAAPSAGFNTLSKLWKIWQLFYMMQPGLKHAASGLWDRGADHRATAVPYRQNLYILGRRRPMQVCPWPISVEIRANGWFTTQIFDNFVSEQYLFFVCQNIPAIFQVK